MEKNVGGVDRTVRIALGTLLVLAAVGGVAGLYALGTTVAAVLAVVGVVLLATGLLQTCIIYRFIGVNTNKRETGEQESAPAERPT
ncbi:DUF2892 domain-containing protein [Halobacteriaceae archaeon GCM10025711]